MSTTQSILTCYSTSSDDLQFIEANRMALSDLPDRFYRVFYEESATIYDDKEGFKAKAYYGISGDLRQAVKNHSDWSRLRNEPSPFISVFSRQDSAFNWIRRLIADPDSDFTNICLAEIDVETLHEKSYGIFKTTELHERLDMRWVPTTADQYLCLWEIPHQAIIKVIHVESRDDINFYIRKGKKMVHLGTNPP